MITKDRPPRPAPSPTLRPYEDLERLIGLMPGDEKHTDGLTSTLDILWVLYDRILRVDATAPEADERDRFLLSKGHQPKSYYAVLAAKGFIDEETLRGYGGYDSPLGYHPDRTLIPGVEISSGSLGHGLPLAVGLLLGLAARGNSESRVFCLLGDAELDEGSNHEAIAVARRLKLERLTAVVIDNRSSSLGWPGGIESRFAAEAWSAVTVDGRDHVALEEAFRKPHPGRPHVVVARVEAKQ